MSVQSTSGESATVYSDVSFMGRDTVAFSLRLRHSGGDIRPMGSSMVASFLPDLVPTTEEIPNEDGEPVFSPVSASEAADMLEEYDGCPEDHPDCNVREERWEQIEEVLRKDTAELQALEAVIFEARAGRDAAKSKRELVTTRLEEKDDQNLDKQQNVRKLKDEIQIAKKSTEDQYKGIRKIQTEIDALIKLIDEQEKALANDGTRDSTRTEIVAPCRRGYNKSLETQIEELAVRSLPRNIGGGASGGSVGSSVRDKPKKKKNQTQR